MTTTCPRCGTPFELNPRAQLRSATSRKDNTTVICNPCGTDEAMCDLHGVDIWPNYPNPIPA